jgi:pectinesterase
MNSIFCQNELYNDLKNYIDIVVALDGTGNYTSLKDAISAVPDNKTSRTIIFLKKGRYFEKIYIPSSKKNLVIIGEDVDSTVISYDDYSGKVVNGTTLNTFNSETFRVDADDFWAINLTFENSAYKDPNGTVSQAPALYTNGDRQVFLHVRVLGFQDTYYSGSKYRAYFNDCFIAGTVDFIFGPSTVIFDSCQIHTLRTGGYMTAANTDESKVFGYVFLNCRLTATPGLTDVFLGRPWGAYAKTVFYKCWEGKNICIYGWKDWSGREKTCFYAEYKCFGPGSDTLRRVSFGKQLTDNQAAEYTIENIYSKNTDPSRFTSDWIPNVDDDSIFRIVNRHLIRFLDSTNINSDIKSLLYNGEQIQGFDPNKYLYSFEIPEETIVIPKIGVSTVNSRANVNITYPKILPGFANITITSYDKTTSKTYKIYYSVNNSFKNANLDSITILGIKIEGFKPDVYEYNVVLPEGTTDYAMAAFPSVSGAKAQINKPSSLPGFATVIVTAVDGVSLIEYKVYISVKSKIYKNAYFDDCPIFENPFKDELNFSVEIIKQGNIQLSIYNIDAQLVYKKIIECNFSGRQHFSLTNNLPKGIYFYNLYTDGKFYYGKILKI